MARIDDAREIVEKVMGWEVPERADAFVALQISPLWDPYENPRAALEVVEAMRRKDWCADMKQILTGHWQVSLSKPDGSMATSGVCLTFCEAICTAALAAIREGQ